MSALRAPAAAAGWEGQAWARMLRVPVTTLDALVARHGTPAFIKIDVEGFEAEALAGLTRPPPALSFEFTTIQRDVAATCIARCISLGCRRFNAMLGESHALVHAGWLDGEEIAAWLQALPHAVNARIPDQPSHRGQFGEGPCAAEAGRAVDTPKPRQGGPDYETSRQDQRDIWRTDRPSSQSDRHASEERKDADEVTEGRGAAESDALLPWNGKDEQPE